MSNNKNMQSKMEYENFYTDLALEARERYEDDVEIKGVSLEKIDIKNPKMTVTRMEILNENGASKMGKPKGEYITIESRCFLEDVFVDGKISRVIAKQINGIMDKLTKSKNIKKILVVGLGNKKATPDALGPFVIDKLNISDRVICIAPGVLAQTGMETYKIVKGIVEQEKPDLVIAVDSLAARNTSRVATTVQITDTGIIPGSGIGNHRMGLNRATMGVPVIAIGVPMVVNSVTIVHDTMEELLEFLKSYEELSEVTELFDIFDKEEKYALIDEIMSTETGKMYVTPKDVDDIIMRLTFILSDALNMALA